MYSSEKLSEDEVEMDRKNWERRNSDITLYETNQQLESQRLEQIKLKWRKVDNLEN